MQGDDGRLVDERALMRRLGWRLLPILILVFLSAFLDRQNVGFAKLQMLADLRMSETAYGFGASLFFIGYVVFEMPSSLALQRYGARLWIACMVFSWGLITILLAFTSSAAMFYVLRFLLGVAQAGFFPGAIFYISTWFPKSSRTPMLGLFAIGSTLGNMLGGVLNGALLDLNGVWGLSGWEWIFLGSGAPAILLAFVVLSFLPSDAREARFLSDHDRKVLAAAHLREQPDGAVHGRPWASLWDPKVIGFGLIYVLIGTSFYAVTYWLPTIVSGFGVTATVNGLMNAIPWMLGALLLVTVPRMASTDRAIFRIAALVTLAGVVGFLTSALVESNAVRFAAIAIGGACITILSPLFWTFPPRYFAGARSAASIAAINSIGNLGGFFAQNLMPWMQTQAGSASGAMLVPAACLALLCLGAIGLGHRARPKEGKPLRA
jgi:MFS family permease